MVAQTGNLTERLLDDSSIHSHLKSAAAQLTESESAALDAQLLLAHVLRRSRSYLAAHPEQHLQPAQAQQFDALLRRRAAGEPVAYLTGEREFWSLALSVTPAVLIPRPETELAVQCCLDLMQAASGRAADLGTGSGAIALALASERPRWHITATELMPEALQVAAANARRLALSNVEFVQGDWTAPLRMRHFDLVVSNPPYIGAADPALPTLRFEPRMALTPGVTGMEALARIIVEAAARLLPGGWLVLEHGADQAAEVATALVAAGYARVRCHSDLAGRERVSLAQWRERQRGT